jgi:hypothetical protein
MEKTPTPAVHPALSFGVSDLQAHVEPGVEARWNELKNSMKDFHGKDAHSECRRVASSFGHMWPKATITGLTMATIRTRSTIGDAAATMTARP